MFVALSHPECRATDAFQEEGDWQKLAWWIHDHLPYSSLYFFPKYWAFNISWFEQPARTIHSYTSPKGCLTKPGMENHVSTHEHEWAGIEKAMKS